MRRTFTMLPKTRSRLARVACGCAQGLVDVVTIAAIAWACERTASAQVNEPPLPGGAPASAPPLGPPATGGSECFPACRQGYVCHLRQCISACNPPCPSGQTCVAGQRCEMILSSSPIPEPPLPPPSTRGFADRSFVMLGFHYGFPGTIETSRGALGGENPLASTLGFNLRGDVPIEKYLVLGPLFQFGAWRPDVNPEPSRSYYVDLDLYIRARIPITTSSTNFQIWGGVPIGITFDMLGDNVAPGASSAALGWNFGVMGGAAVHFTPKIGLYTEIGWTQHKFTHDAEPSVAVRLSQWVLNVGFVFPQ
ncbi:MAG: hypothetical protein ABW133_05765 [Polyangiaceae bacterium]